MKKEKMALDVVNPQAAGIDVGSRSHYVAIGQADADVKEFGVYNEDLIALAQWLLDNQVKTVAMESTGTYWQSLFTTLQSVGIEVILCNGKFTKNIKKQKDRCERLPMDSKASHTWSIKWKLSAR
jgi:transposase